jgi:hypothetical protein
MTDTAKEGELVSASHETLPMEINPDVMIQTAIQQNFDIDKLEKLIALKERCDANDAKKAYVTAMGKFRKECPAIEKTCIGQNDKKFAGLAETLEQIKKLMAKHGLSHSWETKQEKDWITVTCNITHTGGHTAQTTLSGEPDSGGNKNKIQSIGSTVSYLERYTLFAALGLAGKDQDNDGADGKPNPEDEKITESQELDLLAIIDEVGADKNAFMRACKVQSLADIKKRNFKRALQMLENKRKK